MPFLCICLLLAYYLTIPSCWRVYDAPVALDLFVPKALNVAELVRLLSWRWLSFFCSGKIVHGNSVGWEFVHFRNTTWSLNVIMPFIMFLELPVFLMEVSHALMQCENSPFSPQPPKTRHISLSWFSWNSAKHGNTCVWQTQTMVLVIFSEQSYHMHNIHILTIQTSDFSLNFI